MGVTIKKGSEKGSQRGLPEGAWNAPLRSAPPLGVRPNFPAFPILTSVGGPWDRNARTAKKKDSLGVTYRVATSVIGTVAHAQASALGALKFESRR